MAPLTDVDAAHLPAYMDEFVFRLNRRTSRSRGLVFYRVLQLAVDHVPVPYKDLVAAKHPSDKPQAPPVGRGRPPSLDRPRADRPWRTLNSG